MLYEYEYEYANLVRTILKIGEKRETRAGDTRAIFGRTITVDLNNGFPLLQGRKLFYKGILGELAAMLRQPKTIKDFEDQGCNYWKLWGKEDGTINLDYGNKWLDWDGVNQLQNVLHTLKTSPTDRRMIVTGWDPSNLDNLDLPCCHYAYQWYVRDGKYLDMLWHQRSVDVMIGLPSDVIFAAAWLIAMCEETGYKPGKITFTLGDTHIYESHVDGAFQYLENYRHISDDKIQWSWSGGDRTIEFIPPDLVISNYNIDKTIKFDLKA